MDGEAEQEEPSRVEEEVRPTLRREWRSVETRQSPGGEDVPEGGEVSFTYEERDDLHLRREQRHREEQEEEQEQHKMPDKVDFFLHCYYHFQFLPHILFPNQ